MLKFLELFGFGQRRCAHCSAPFFPAALGHDPAVETLCLPCLRLFTPASISIRCRGCGLPLPNAHPANPDTPLCQTCRTESVPWTWVAYYDIYRGPLRDLVLRLKFDGQLHLSPTLATFLLNSCSCLTRPDAITPIPQHPSRLRKRGYNQAHEIARELCRQSGLPFHPALLRRVTSGVAQEGLSAAQRRKNLEKAFHGDKSAKGLSIWLVDDVFTSGSTARAAASALLNAGAASVQLLFVARTDYS